MNSISDESKRFSVSDGFSEDEIFQCGEVDSTKRKRGSRIKSFIESESDDEKTHKSKKLTSSVMNSDYENVGSIEPRTSSDDVVFKRGEADSTKLKRRSRIRSFTESESDDDEIQKCKKRTSNVIDSDSERVESIELRSADDGNFKSFEADSKERKRRSRIKSFTESESDDEKTHKSKKRTSSVINSDDVVFKRGEADSTKLKRRSRIRSFTESESDDDEIQKCKKLTSNVIDSDSERVESIELRSADDGNFKSFEADSTKRKRRSRIKSFTESESDEDEIQNRKKRTSNVIISDSESIVENTYDDHENGSSEDDDSGSSLSGFVVSGGDRKSLRDLLASCETSEDEEDMLFERFDFTRPDTIRGEKQGRDYEERKALTVAKLEEIQEMLTSCPNEDEILEQPKNLKISLLPHQLHGLKCMTWRESLQLSGGLIADEMGSGKTAVAIALIVERKPFQILKEAKSNLNHKGGTLIVAPAGLLKQWEDEFIKFCKPNVLNIYKFHGSDRELDSRKLAVKYDVVLTSYALVKNDHERGTTLFKIDWERVFLDEGHMIRNEGSLRATACFALSAKYRWILTGTPIQNKESDLFSLIRFLRFSPFDNRTNWRHFIATSEDCLSLILKTVMLRRSKKELEESGSLDKSPGMKVVEIPIFLSPPERQVYELLVSLSRAAFFRFMELKGELYNYDAYDKALSGLGKRLAKILKKSCIKRNHLYVLLIRLRQLTCHPSLISAELPEENESNEYSEDTSEDENENSIDKLPYFNLPTELQRLQRKISEINEDDCFKVLKRNNPVFDAEYTSAKINALLPAVEEKLQKGDKVIIVSNFVKFLEIVADVLIEKEIQFFMYTGKTSLLERDRIVKEFNMPDSAVKVLLLSMIAGGTGLNLTGANNMFILDLHWNPQQENQAIARINRIGQTKSATIYKFVCDDTIEEHVLEIQSRKIAIAENALDGGKRESFNHLSIDDMKIMFGLE